MSQFLLMNHMVVTYKSIINLFDHIGPNYYQNNKNILFKFKYKYILIYGSFNILIHKFILAKPYELNDRNLEWFFINFI